MTATGGPSRSSGSARSALVGRDRELSLLRQHLNAVGVDRGSVVLIGGEAGIGKTTLAEWIAAEASVAGSLVVIGHCYDVTTAPPYGPWVDLLDALDRGAPGLVLPLRAIDAELLSRPESQAEVFDRVWTTLRAAAAARPTVLIIEDLHWADVASLDLLRYVARQVPAQPLLLLATYRVDELTRRHPLFQRLPALVRESHATRIDLKRLSANELREIVTMRFRLVAADETRLVRYLEQQSEGNPFYCGELLRALEAEGVLTRVGDHWRLGDVMALAIPPLILQVIETRLARLQGRTRDLLAVAAVIGQEVDLELWSSVSDADDEELAGVVEQAIEAALLIEQPRGAGLRFTHALIREALSDGVVLPRRRTWHRRTAEVLAARSQPDASAIAHHFQQSADPRAATWLVAAGEHARLLHAPHAAIEYFSSGLRLRGDLDARQQLACRRSRSLAYETIGELDLAQADLDAAVELARSTRDAHAEWQTLLDLGMLWASRDYARTVEYYQQGLALARSVDDPAMIARSLNRLGNWYLNNDQPQVARRFHEEALDACRALGDRRGLAESLDFLGAAVSVCADLEQSAICFQQAVALFRELGDRQALSAALATAAERGGAIGLGALVPVTTLAECQHDAEQALAIAREIGWRAGEAYALIQLGAVLTARGELGPALETLQAALTIAQAIEHRQWIALAHGFLGYLYGVMLCAAEAREHCERSLELARQVRSVILERLSTVFLVLALNRQRSLADASLLLGSNPTAELGVETVSLTSALMQLGQAEMALTGDEPDRALQLVERLVARLPNAAPDRAPLWPTIVRGEALTRLRRWDEAEATLRAAIRDAAHHGALPARLRAYLGLIALYRAQGRGDAAEQVCAEADVVISRLSDTILDPQLREEFRQQAESLVLVGRSATVASIPPLPLGLSSREVEVLRLVAEGLTDAEVAGRLYISRRTVTSHLTSIYNKLGVSTRTAAARVASEHALV